MENQSNKFKMKRPPEHRATREEMVGADIDSTSFLLALKQLSRSGVAPEAINTLLTSIFIEQANSRSNDASAIDRERPAETEDDKTLRSLSNLARRHASEDQGCNEVIQLLTVISVGSERSDEGSRKRQFEETVEQQRVKENLEDRRRRTGRSKELNDAIHLSYGINSHKAGNGNSLKTTVSSDHASISNGVIECDQVTTSNEASNCPTSSGTTNRDQASSNRANDCHEQVTSNKLVGTSNYPTFSVRNDSCNRTCINNEACVYRGQTSSNRTSGTNNFTVIENEYSIQAPKGQASTSNGTTGTSSCPKINKASVCLNKSPMGTNEYSDEVSTSGEASNCRNQASTSNGAGTTETSHFAANQENNNSVSVSDYHSQAFLSNGTAGTSSCPEINGASVCRNQTHMDTSKCTDEVSTSGVASNCRNQASTSNEASRNAYQCYLCPYVCNAVFRIKYHYTHTHDLPDPEQVLFYDGKPLFFQRISNIKTVNGTATWFKKQKDEAIKRYKYNFCRLCDVHLEVTDILIRHYRKHHKVKNFVNLEELFKFTAGTNLVDLPTSNPRKQRKPRKSKSTDKAIKASSVANGNLSKDLGCNTPIRNGSSESAQRSFVVDLISDDEDDEMTYNSIGDHIEEVNHDFDTMEIAKEKAECKILIASVKSENNETGNTYCKDRI